jgi:hypothetical protein
MDIDIDHLTVTVTSFSFRSLSAFLYSLVSSFSFLLSRNSDQNSHQNSNKSHQTMEAEQASSENGTWSEGPEALELSYDKVLNSVTQVCYL